MKKNSKLIGLILILSIFSIVLAGCEEEANLNIKTDIALLEEIVDGGEGSLLFSVNNEEFKLKARDKSQLEKLEEDEFYIIAYDSNHNLLSSKTFNFQYREEDKHILDDPKSDVSSNPIAIRSEGIDLDSYNLYDAYEFSFTDEDNIDTIALYVDAEKDESGEFMFDDGHNWILTAQTDGGDYLLYEDRIQIGDANFHIMTKDDNFYITLIVTDTASFKLIEYMYDEDSRTFLPRPAYEMGGDLNFIR